MTLLMIILIQFNHFPFAQICILDLNHFDTILPQKWARITNDGILTKVAYTSFI